MVPFLECKRQYDALRDDLDAAVAAVCRKGWFVQGENAERFEAASRRRRASTGCFS